MGLQWEAECFLLGPVWVIVERLVLGTGLLLAKPGERGGRGGRKVPVGLEAAALDGNGPNPSDPCFDQI